MTGPGMTSMPPPPPPGQSATWMPPPAPLSAPAPTVPMFQRMSPEHLGERIPWVFLAFLAQSIGLLLVFVGGLLAVTAGVYPPSCFNSTCSAGNTFANVGYGIMAARLLLVLGLFGLAAGAGLHLQFRPGPAADATPEATRIYLARRRAEFVMLILTIVILFLVAWWSVQVPT